MSMFMHSTGTSRFSIVGPNQQNIIRPSTLEPQKDGPEGYSLLGEAHLFKKHNFLPSCFQMVPCVLRFGVPCCCWFSGKLKTEPGDGSGRGTSAAPADLQEGKCAPTLAEGDGRV